MILSIVYKNKKGYSMDFNKLNVPPINITDYDRVIHLSYVDLDGFSCSMLTHEAREGYVEQLRTQGSAGVDKTIDELVVKGKDHKEGTLLILITGLYINIEQCAKLDAINTGNVDVRAISNHYTQGTILEDRPSWYYTNTDASAAALLYAAIIESATTNIGYLEEFMKKKDIYMESNELNVSALNITDYDHVIHLSHVDLDGFSCSTLVHKAREGNVEQINVEDRAGADKTIEELVVKGKSHTSGSLLILITDLYITKEQRATLDAVNTGNVDVRAISNNHTRCFELEDYQWYYNNESVSSTASLYAAISGPSTAHIGYFDEFVKAVSAYDTFDRTNWNVFASGEAIDDGLYTYLRELKKDDDYTRDVAIWYLAEIAKVIEGGVFESTPTVIESGAIRTWRKALRLLRNQYIITINRLLK